VTRAAQRRRRRLESGERRRRKAQVARKRRTPPRGEAVKTLAEVDGRMRRASGEAKST